MPIKSTRTLRIRFLPRVVNCFEACASVSRFVLISRQTWEKKPKDSCCCCYCFVGLLCHIVGRFSFNLKYCSLCLALFTRVLDMSMKGYYVSQSQLHSLYSLCYRIVVVTVHSVNLLQGIYICKRVYYIAVAIVLVLDLLPFLCLEVLSKNAKRANY